MNRRDEVIKWCKDYLPSWPQIEHNTQVEVMARPMGWKWEIMRLPHMSYNTLVLVNGIEGCNAVTEGNVFPAKVAPPIQPPMYSNRLKEFLESVNLLKKSTCTNEKCQILMMQDDFDKIYNEYLPLKMSSNHDRTSSMVDGISVRVLNNDIIVINKFIEEYEKFFILHCMKMNVDPNSVRDTLIAE